MLFSYLIWENLLKGFKKDGKFRPTGRTKSALYKKDLKQVMPQSVFIDANDLTRRRTFFEEGDPSLEDKLQDFEEEWDEELNHDPDIPHENWDVSIFHITEHSGSSNTEKFLIDASSGGDKFESIEEIDTTDWLDDTSEKYKKRLETDKAFASHEFNRWLRDYFEEDSLEIFMGLKKSNSKRN